jgi:hypothetical protein
VHAKDAVAGGRGIQDGADEPADEEVVPRCDEDGREYDEREGSGKRTLGYFLVTCPGQC